MNKNIEDIGLGMLPPSAVDIEEAVLGAMIIEPNSVPVVADILRPEMFYSNKHLIVFHAIIKLFSEQKSIDLMTVTHIIKEMGELESAGGVYEITLLTQKVVSSANIEYHAHIIIQKYIQREIIRVGREMLAQGFAQQTDPFDLLNNTISALLKLNAEGLSGKAEIVGRIYSEIITTIDKIRSGETSEAGVFTHIKALDELINGLKAPDLFILAARPGMGKTALIVSISRSITADNIPVAVFSMEMSKEQLTKRVMSQLSHITYSEIDRPNKLSDSEVALLNGIREDIESSPLYIDDTPALNIMQLQSKAIELKANYGIALIVVDYLQLMSGVDGKKGATSREAEIASISRGLKGLAKSLNIPVIALSQLNRGVEARPDKRPKLSDLRESGAIEQDADIVGMLYRPAYYGITEIGQLSAEDVDSFAELIIVKHRNGATATLQLRFIANTMNYIDFVEASNNPGDGIVEKDIAPLDFPF